MNKKGRRTSSCFIHYALLEISKCVHEVSLAQCTGSNSALRITHNVQHNLWRFESGG